LIPLLIYKTLRFVSSRVAFCGAWLSIVTLLPYNFQTYLFPDPMQLFLSILFCYFVVRYIFERTTQIMIGMFLVYLALSFFRPPFLLFYLLIATVVAIAAWQDHKNLIAYFKPFIALTLLVGSIHVFASALDTYLYKQILEHKTLGNPFIYEIFGDHGTLTGMRPHIFKLMDPVILKKLIAPFSAFALEIWPSIYRAMLPIESFLTILALLYAGYCSLRTGIQNLRRDIAVLFTVFGVFLLYSVPMCILTDPQFRYVSAGALFLVMSGTIALRILIIGFFPTRCLRHIPYLDRFKKKASENETLPSNI
jgi:hypothetical protein